MVTLRKRGRKPTKEEGNNEIEEGGGGVVSQSGYEQSREQRIKENMERMQKLGILDLSKKLKSVIAPPKRSQKNPSVKKKTQNPLVSDPPRRSSRLKTVAPVSYKEIKPKQKLESFKKVEVHIQDGSEPEIYNEEHLKLLGDCKASWTLCLDGYDEDGNRIYDAVDGESCHQCRQKTLGHRTHCSKCNLVQGQLCGDCLYARYGEHVLETKENPNWICPVCRGICNCSRCRRAKGWNATGSIYRKVVSLGFKSVAHYLIQTRQSSKISKDPGAENLVLAETLLPPMDSRQPSSNKEHINIDEGSDGDYEPDDHEDDEMEEGHSSDSKDVDTNGAKDKYGEYGSDDESKGKKDIKSTDEMKEEEKEEVHSASESNDTSNANSEDDDYASDD